MTSVLILASESSLPATWPAVVAMAVIVACIALVYCTIITGRWPWDRS